MKKYKPVSISSGSFMFCRIAMAVIIWVAFIFKLKFILIIAFLIFLASFVLKIKRAPMIVLYDLSINKIFKSNDELLNEYAMSFAHMIGSIFSFICIIFLYFISDKIGWGLVLVFAILKSISAVGFCPASKLYECATGDSCCAFVKKK